jgi:hypothetical protein
VASGWFERGSGDSGVEPCSSAFAGLIKTVEELGVCPPPLHLPNLVLSRERSLNSVELFCNRMLCLRTMQ